VALNCLGGDRRSLGGLAPWRMRAGLVGVLLALACCAPPDVVVLDEGRATSGALELRIRPHVVGGGERLLVSYELRHNGEVARRVALVGAPASGQRYLLQTGTTLQATGAGFLAQGALLFDVRGPGAETLTASIDVTLTSDRPEATVVDQRLNWSSWPILLEGDGVYLLPKEPDGRPTRLESHPDLEEVEADPEAFLRELLRLQPGLRDEL
jgi:hypothetical protein